MSLREKIEPYIIYVIHCSGLAVFMFWVFDVVNKGLWYEFLIFLVCDLLFGAFGISGTFHRLFAHKSYEAPRWWHLVGGAFGTLALQGSSIAWASVHRQHHKFSDTPKDPHSPQIKGPWWVFFKTIFAKPNIKNSVDLLRDPLHLAFFKYYWHITITYLIAIGCFFGWRALLFAWWMPICKIYFTSTFVNAWGHGWNIKGSKPTNSNFIGFISMGEGWHQTHHQHSNHYRCHPVRYLFDVGSWPGYLFSKYKNKEN